MGRADPGFLAVGRLTRAHGIRGELLVASLTDHPEDTFVPGVVLRLGDAAGREPDPAQAPLRVESARVFKDGWLVGFAGLETRTDAEALRGRYLLRAASELEPPAEGEVYRHELVGLEVVTADGRRVGVVRELYELSGADMLEVEGDGTRHLIPFRAEIVVRVDLDAGRIVVDPPPGLLDL